MGVKSKVEEKVKEETTGVSDEKKKGTGELDTSCDGGKRVSETRTEMKEELTQ